MKVNLVVLGRKYTFAVQSTDVRRQQAQFSVMFSTYFRFGGATTHMAHEGGPFARLEDAVEYAKSKSAWLCVQLDDIVTARVVDGTGKEFARFETEFVRKTKQVPVI